MALLHAVPGLAAKKDESSETKSSEEITKTSAKKSSKKSKAKKSQAQQPKWNKICRDLLRTSVKSTITLEKQLRGKRKKLSDDQFEQKVQDELLVVQLNAWVCALSTNGPKAAQAEKDFLLDYSKKVQDRGQM